MASTPVIGISCSTLPEQEVGDHRRFAVPDYYVECVVAAGGLPLILPNVAADSAPAYLARIDGLVLSGGDDVDPHIFGEDPHPKLGLVDLRRDHFEIALSKGILAQGIPTLSICRGIQVLNVAAGGTVIQDIPDQVEGAIRHAQNTVRRSSVGHAIDIEPGSRLHEMAGTERTHVNTYHHQAAGRVGDGLVVTARAPDGIIEALEAPAHPWCVAVQWHPERCPEDPLTQALFAGVVEAARKAAHAGT